MHMPTIVNANSLTKKHYNEMKSPFFENANEIYTMYYIQRKNSLWIDMTPTIERGGGRKRDSCDIPSSLYPIFDVPSFLTMTSRVQPRGDSMKSNRRANPLQATLRVMSARRILENDDATSLSNWPVELAPNRQEPMTILLSTDRVWLLTWETVSTLCSNDWVGKPKVNVV